MYDLSCSAKPVQKLAFLAEQFGQPRFLEQGRSKMPRYQSRKALQLRGNRKNQRREEMVDRSGPTNKLLKRVAEIYKWLHEQVRDNSDLAGTCDVCGKCCDFDTPAPAAEREPAPEHEQGFDHRLFVTPPELMYLAANLGAENVKPMPDNRCPYHLVCTCTVYEYRFAGCRIFSCKGNADFQSRLSESVLKKLKSLCTEFQITYHYTDLATALNNPALRLLRKPHQ